MTEPSPLDPPSRYDDERRGIWDDAITRLNGRHADPELLNAYVEAVRSHRQASRLLAASNVLIVRDGKTSENPALAVQRKAAADMARAARVLGLTGTDKPERPVDNSRGRGEIKPWERRQLCRELATGETRRADLARRYGVTRQGITEFAKRHAAEIDDIKASLDDEFAGLWIAGKAARIAVYQSDLEMSLDAADDDGRSYGSHYEHIRTRAQLLRAVAEELGQLPPRATVTVVPVAHIIEGVDPGLLK